MTSRSWATSSQSSTTPGYLRLRGSARSRSVEYARWTLRRAHMLLQTRVQILINDLRCTFDRRLSRMESEEPPALKEAA